MDLVNLLALIIPEYCTICGHESVAFQTTFRRRRVNCGEIGDWFVSQIIRHLIEIGFVKFLSNSQLNHLLAQGIIALCRDAVNARQAV